ncbi:acyltransferase family protein [Aureibacillus halotolerans]|uniref:Membrane-bound acyltransferase YfiQ involved in biofilm formation n=1 Tax=Aureibacillus halotolerans TaxID=1508390 RepID=A0A4R6UA89_9BACI|nr:acyltransferase family protein [Aureibacillus halotolerans]TDQ42756.1 membrane-bound acyltransferase YfiQ involved in biofilm formation [Aureibacillus halotolerans]
MEKAKWLSELTFLRAIACVSIVLLHTIERALLSSHYGDISISARVIWESFYMVLFYGTPTFIFLSEVLIAYLYKDKPLPKGFFKKRFLYLFLPYLALAMFYAWTKADGWSDFVWRSFMHAVIGDYHGYFVLIIFQFYGLHWLLKTWMSAQKPYRIVGYAFVINVAYLAVFNFIPAPNIPHGEYIWERYYWVPFPGWLFYFVAGFYVGQSYDKVRSWIKMHYLKLLAAPLVTSVLVLVLVYTDVLTVASSKRVDMLLHSSAMVLGLLALAIVLPKAALKTEMISRYSFGIYLWHMYFLYALNGSLEAIEHQLPMSLYIVVLCVGAILLSMGSMKIINLLPGGATLTGQVKPSTKNRTSSVASPERKASI